MNARRKQRQEQAVIRQKFWSSLTPEQQLEDLDRRLGEGVGALKQRTKLKAEVERLRLEKQKKERKKKAKTEANND